MPYSTPWDNTAPLGSADPRLIDDFFRELKLQIEERMNSILDPAHQWKNGTDLIALPATTPGGGGGGSGLGLPQMGTIVYPPHLVFGGTIVGYTSSFVTMSGTYIFPITMEEVLGAVRLLSVSMSYNDSSNVVSWTFSKTTYPNTTGTPITSGSTLATGANANTQIFNNLLHGEQTFEGGNRYTIGFSGGPFNLFGVKLLYEINEPI